MNSNKAVTSFPRARTHTKASLPKNLCRSSLGESEESCQVQEIVMSKDEHIIK